MPLKSLLRPQHTTARHDICPDSNQKFRWMVTQHRNDFNTWTQAMHRVKRCWETMPQPSHDLMLGKARSQNRIWYCVENWCATFQGIQTIPYVGTLGKFFAPWPKTKARATSQNMDSRIQNPPAPEVQGAWSSGWHKSLGKNLLFLIGRDARLHKTL